jgi:hypothetical protein
MAFEIPSAVIAIGTIMAKAVKYGDKLWGAEDEMQVATMLLSTISETAADVASSRARLAKSLSLEKCKRIDSLLDRTNYFMGITKKMLSRHEKHDARRERPLNGAIRFAGKSLQWVLRDKDKVVSYQTILGCLHMTLLVVNQELSSLRGDPPGYGEIYSQQSKEAIVAGLERWCKEDAGEDGKILSDDSCREIEAEYLRNAKGYTAEARSALAAEVVKRRAERPHLQKGTRNKTMGGAHKSALEMEMRKRLKERNSY